MDIYKSGKLANDYYYCQKRPNIAPKSKILEEKFENVVKGRIKQFGVGEVLQFPSLPQIPVPCKTLTKLANRAKRVKIYKKQYQNVSIILRSVNNPSGLEKSMKSKRTNKRTQWTYRLETLKATK